MSDTEGGTSFLPLLELMAAALRVAEMGLDSNLLCADRENAFRIVQETLAVAGEIMGGDSG